MPRKNIRRQKKGGSDDYKVLIVVDVQNCFIQGGSLGSENIEDLYNYIIMVENISNEIKNGKYDLVVFSKDYHPEFHASLYDETKPVHLVYKHHCRNMNRKCKNIYGIDEDEYNKTRTQTAKTLQQLHIEINQKIENIENILSVKVKEFKCESFDKLTDLIGTDESTIKKYYTQLHYPLLNQLKYIQRILSLIPEDKLNTSLSGVDFSFLFNVAFNNDSQSMLMISLMNQNVGQLYNVYDNNIKQLYSNHHTILMTQKDKISEEPNISNTNWEIVIPYEYNNIRCINLMKGEYCNYESYSAFNYHFKISNDDTNETKKNITNNKQANLTIDKAYSTGLFEFIFKDKNKIKPSAKELTINVCGLVTNICVINTIQQGLALWNGIYKNDVQNIDKCTFNMLEYACLPLYIPDIYKSIYYPYKTPIGSLENKKQLVNAIILFKEKFKSDIFDSNASKLQDGLNLDDYAFNMYISNDSYITIKPYEDTYKIIQGGGRKYTKTQRNKIKTPKTLKPPKTPQTIKTSQTTKPKKTPSIQRRAVNKHIAI